MVINMHHISLILAYIVIQIYSDRGSEQLARQLMLTQLEIEEKVRSDGDSGIKLTRLREQGSRPYHSTTHTRGSMFSIHDHSNHYKTVGMGELEAVLNGVHFRTRHNDYMLKQKSSLNQDYNAVDDIEFPRVPEQVTSKKSESEQIAEMALWMKAFAEQNITIRDYRPYFPANLCYLEGAWTTSKGTIEESFDSDRHFLDAKTWFQMQENIRYTSYTGSKDNLENYSYLPTKLFKLINGSIPVFAQWNYRILCHRLKNDLPTNRLRVVEDLKTMLTSGKSTEQLRGSRGARFNLNTRDTSRFQDGIKNYDLLDELMYEIPGKDNYKTNLTEAQGIETYVYGDLKRRLKPGMYHRWYSTRAKDAGGRNVIHRGFNDASCFFAMTSQDKIAGMTHKYCKGRGRAKKCNDVTQKWSYAIPLEIIYTTPLQTWNPYNIQYKVGVNAASVTNEGTLDGRSQESALNGTANKYFYRTPAAMFSSTQNQNGDPADTVAGSMKVRDSSGGVRTTVSSGTRIHISGVRGVKQAIRQRYPIAPLHDEGSSVWKELEALKDIILHRDKYEFVFKKVEDKPGNPSKAITLFTGPGSENHIHKVLLSAADVETLRKNGAKVNIVTSSANGHSHSLVVARVRRYYVIVKCDSRKACSDGHPANLNSENGNEKSAKEEKEMKERKEAKEAAANEADVKKAAAKKAAAKKAKKASDARKERAKNIRQRKAKARKPNSAKKAKSP